MVVNLVGALLGSTCIFGQLGFTETFARGRGKYSKTQRPHAQPAGFPGLFAVCEERFPQLAASLVADAQTRPVFGVLRRKSPYGLIALSLFLAATGLLVK